MPGKLPSPAPRASLGRDESIEDAIRLAMDLEPMAWIDTRGSYFPLALTLRLPYYGGPWPISGSPRLWRLSIASRILYANEERELSAIETLERARRLNSIASFLLNDKDGDAAEKIAESIKLREKDEEYQGRQKEGHLPLQGSAQSRILLPLAPSPVLGSLFHGGAFFR